MENFSPDPAPGEFPLAPEKPQFLKVLCILSFIACGLWILLYSIGSFTLAMDESVISTFWEKFAEANPDMEDADPVEFFHQVGIVSVYCLIANIFSLVGVIMMWRLEKIGFFIYAIAELATNFFGVHVEGMEDTSYGGTIFMIIIDVVFIVMYAMNLKYMGKKTNNTFIQSGS